MRKVFYNSWIARWFLASGYSTITLGAFIFTRYHDKYDMGEYVLAHEDVHVRQWSEITAVSAIIIWAVLICTSASALWLLMAPFVFYALYIIEFLIKYIFCGYRNAYREISFEREARRTLNMFDYSLCRRYFSWIPLIFRRP